MAYLRLMTSSWTRTRHGIITLDSGAGINLWLLVKLLKFQKTSAEEESHQDDCSTWIRHQEPWAEDDQVSGCCSGQVLGGTCFFLVTGAIRGVDVATAIGPGEETDLCYAADVEEIDDEIIEDAESVNRMLLKVTRRRWTIVACRSRRTHGT